MKIGGNTQRWENKNYRERGQFTLLAVFEILMEGEKKVGWRLERRPLFPLYTVHCLHLVQVVPVSEVDKGQSRCGWQWR